MIGRGGQSWLSTLLNPIEKRDQPVDLGIAQVLLGHQPAVALLVIELRGILQKSPQVWRAALLCDLGEVGRVVRTFSKQGVAIDAVVLVPGVFAQGDFWRDVLGVGEFGKLAVAVHRETKKHQRGHQR